MTLTQYFIGAWVTALLGMVAAERTRADTKDRLLDILFASMVVTLLWPVGLLIFVGGMIRKAVLR